MARAMLSSILFLFVCIFPLTGQAQESEGPQRYDGHRLVWVQLDSQEDMRTMLGISQDHWSENLGLGTILFRVPPERMRELRMSGLSFEIHHPDVQALIDAERADPSLGAGGWFDDYKTYQEYETFMDGLVTQRSDLISKTVVGQSLEGRDIFCLEITGTNGPAGKPAVLFTSIQHAREWVAGMTTMYFADRLLQEYDTVPQIQSLLDQVVVFIIPIVNPDGYEYTWNNQRLWRKNRRDNGDGTRGVDTNRNFGTGWGGEGSSGSGSSETYRGTAAFSEPETTAMRDFLSAHPELVVHIDFHSYSQLILSPFGFSTGEPGEPDRTLYNDLNAEMQAAIAGVHGENYLAGPAGATLYVASGVFPDWSYGTEGIFSWTIELRPDTSTPGFILPAAQIIPTAEENYEAIKTVTHFASLDLVIDFPEPLPESVQPQTQSPVVVQIAEVSGTIEAGSSKLMWRLGSSGPFAESGLVDMGSSRYEGMLPGAPCGQLIEYYFQAEAEGGGMVTAPIDTQTQLFVADVIPSLIPFEDDMESAQAWTVGDAADDATTGIWTRVDPNGSAAQPEDDHTSGLGALCWVTGQASPGASSGTNDVDGGQTTLTSPAFDGTQGTTSVSYWRWYSNNTNSSTDDIFTVEISNDGANWTLVEVLGPLGPETSGGWIYHEFTLDEIPVAASSQMSVRFVASDESPGSIVEAAIDDFKVESQVACPSVPFTPQRIGEGGAPKAQPTVPSVFRKF